MQLERKCSIQDSGYYGLDILDKVFDEILEMSMILMQKHLQYIQGFRQKKGKVLKYQIMKNFIPQWLHFLEKKKRWQLINTCLMLDI